VYKFNKNLHLCCLLTYCCLLRPHQEIRRLKWSDFNADLSLIRLSGDKVKSKRNRLVPVPQIVRSYLSKSDDNYNIFTITEKSYNSDYFKTLWGRFKRVSKLLEQDPNTLLF
jgi:integrase